MMVPSSCHLARSIIVLLAVSTVLCAGTSVAEQPEASDAAIATADSLEDHEGESEDLESRSVDAADPDQMTVDAGHVEDREATAGDPDTSVAEAGDPEERMATSENLSDLSPAAPDPGIKSLAIPGRAEWDDTTDPSVVVARKHLIRAQARAKTARAAYAEMLQRNYPRGDARLRIVQERDASLEAFERAKQALAEAQN